MASKAATQGGETRSLFEQILPKPDDIEISTAVLNLDEIVDDTDNLQPSESFIQSVLRWGGVFEAIDVRKDGKKYRVIEGRRRLRAMLILRERAQADETIKLDWTIPAKVIKGLKDEASVDAYALMKNRQRSDNLIFEAGAVQRLYARGATEKDVYELTGLLPQEQERRVTILKAIKPLRKAFDEGRLTIAQLEAAAKMTPDVQQKLADRLKDKVKEAKGVEAKAKVKITGQDIREVKTVRDTTAAAAMPQELFDSKPEDLGGGAPAPSPDPADGSGDKLRGVLDLLKGDHVWKNKHRLGALGSQDIEGAVARIEAIIGAA